MGTWVNGYMGTWVHSYMLRERKESPRIFDLLIQTYDYICIKCCYISDMIESRWDSNACLPHTGTHNGCPDNTTRTENRQHRDRASQWQYCGRGQLVLWQQSGSWGIPTQQCAVAALGPRPCSLRICDLVSKWKEIMHWLILKTWHQSLTEPRDVSVNLAQWVAKVCLGCPGERPGSCGSPTQQCAVAALGPRPCSLRICDLVLSEKKLCIG
jgi:hypothetical protein